jgi:Na+/proline symporter
MLANVDWAIIIAYNLISVTIGVAMTRRAHRSTEEYFLAGRALPWWIAGTSMVATTPCFSHSSYMSASNC